MGQIPSVVFGRVPAVDTIQFDQSERFSLADPISFIIEDGREYFSVEPPEVTGLPSIQRVTLSELDVEDPIFDTLKDEYDFTEWFS